MAVHEHIVLPMYKDQNGDTHLLYAITNVDCIDGLEELLATITTHEHSNKEVLDKIASTVDIYTQADEPVDAIDGSIWFNTGNADGTISILVRRNGSWEISSDGVAQVQPDWEQTDASNPGYIRNKPFGYTADLYVNSTLPFAVGTNKNNIYSAKLPTGLLGSLQEGDNVTVVWDGVVYELTAKNVRVTDFFSLNNALGNGRIVSESYGLNLDTDTGEPFVIAPGLNAIYTRSTISTHSLQIKDDETIIKIDAKFLPDEALNASVQSDWNETDESSAAFIANKPEIPDTDNFATKDYVQEQLSGVSAPDMTGYAKSEDIPTKVSELKNDAGYLTEQVQADWDETDTTSPAYIKNKPVISADGGASVQANWEQNDSTQADYIKNRPFYEYEGQIDVLPLTICENFTLNSTFGLYTYELEANCTLTVGESYKILWDGQVYNCETVDVSAMCNGLPIVALGNGAAYGYPGNNEPFIILNNNDNGFFTFACLLHSEPCERHEVRICQETTFVHPIDKKFLPDDIGSGSSLPEVTTDNNGQVMTVVDGVWTAQTPASGLPEVTISDAGKFLRVSADGVWVAESIQNAEEASF